ncbi:unnamed protein product [Brachionus calyciflorus]|uniref:Arrestin C-terminal-like domain-containing protein n=1 Tax=Brachionus calyciflorus TaxID=104777 RepID=A0A813ZTJ9_9BILA|nr:unnamed protein product [Brachionus calyciflorus]
MGKIDYFTITLQKQNAIYMSSENLRGTLSLRVNERLKINSVKMLISGGARVHWSESHGSGKNRRTVHYSAYEKYLNFDLVFLSKQPNSDLYLEIGDYSYPFDIVLPPNLPTSFEHTVGQVRYSLYGTVDIPWAFDKHTTRSFTVVSHLDLNANPALRQGFGVSDEKVLCCGPCKSDPIIANFNILKSGYVPGEAIVFNATMDNKSSREIKEMSVNLIQVMRFHATRKTRTCVRNVAQIKFPKHVDERTVETWQNSVLVIPPVCSSSNGTCRIIEVGYKVVFNFDASGIAVSKDLDIPIVIGTIPLSLQPSMPAPNIPFTYEGCIFGPNPVDFGNEISGGNNKGETIESDLNTYKPFYPFYKDFSLNNRNV